MFSVKLQYDISKYDAAKLQAAKHDLLNGMTLDEVDDKHDDLGCVALIECAKDLGWDMERYIRENEIEKDMYLYFAFGITQPKAWHGFIMKAAHDYVRERVQHDLRTF